MALSLPDICGALEAKNRRASPARYKAWFEKWMGDQYPELTGDDIYCLRCGVLHEGTFGHHGMKYSKILFSIPNPKGLTLHRNQFSGRDGAALNLDLAVFCQDIIASVAEWMKATADNETVQANLTRLFTLHPHGVPPYIKGVPIIS